MSATETSTDQRYTAEALAAMGDLELQQHLAERLGQLDRAIADYRQGKDKLDRATTVDGVEEQAKNLASYQLEVLQQREITETLQRERDRRYMAGEATSAYTPEDGRWIEGRLLDEGLPGFEPDEPETRHICARLARSKTSAERPHHDHQQGENTEGQDAEAECALPREIR